jgi:hypothetical protein
MCHHYTEARSIEEIRERHRSEEADERFDETPDSEAIDDPEVEAEKRDPPAEPQTPADD